MQYLESFMMEADGVLQHNEDTHELIHELKLRGVNLELYCLSMLPKRIAEQVL